MDVFRPTIVISKVGGVTVVSPASSLPEPSNLISRNEEILVEARRNYYKEASKEKHHEKQLRFGHYIGKQFIIQIYVKYIVKKLETTTNQLAKGVIPSKF